MDYKELHKKTVAELREIAKAQFPDIEGTSAMHKDKLLEVLCEHMGIDRRGHHEAVIAGVSIPELKKQVHALRAEEDKAADKKARKKARKKIHNLKHKMRRLAELEPKAQPKA